MSVRELHARRCPLRFWSPWSERPTGPCPAAWDWPVRPIEKTQHAVFRYLWSNKYQYQATGLWSVRRPEQGLSVGKEGIIEGVATSVRELQARRCLLGLPSPWPEHPTDSSPASWHWPQCPIEKTQNATCFVMCNRAWYQATGPWSVGRPEQGLSGSREGTDEGVARSVRKLAARQHHLGLHSTSSERSTN